MPAPLSRLGFLALCAAALDLLATAMGWHAVRLVTKPLPALILAVAAWRSGGTARQTLGIGLLLAAAGDELLLAPGDAFFLAGMLAFAAMQVAYILAFLASGTTWNPKTRLGAAAATGYGIAYILLLMQLLPHAGTFAAPLAVYGFLLILMASFAAQMTRITAVGALCFVASDMTLAISKFAHPVFAAPLNELAIMGTYFAAQILIVWGMTDAAKQDAEHDQALAEKSPGHL